MTEVSNPPRAAAGAGVDGSMARLRALTTSLDTRPPRGHIVGAMGTIIRAVLPNVAVGELCRLVDPRTGHAMEAEVVGLAGHEVLLTPTRVYAKHCLELIQELNDGEERPLHAMSHITGGGFAANLARVIPAELSVRIDRSTWAPAPVFGLVGLLGDVALPELEKTLNMGAGMVAVLDPSSADAAIAALAARDIPAWVCGDVTPAPGGTVTLEGSYSH